MRNLCSLAIAALLMTLALGPASLPSHAAPNQFAINVDTNGNALLGYDTVAYFRQGKAMRGTMTFSHVWKGARWLFATAENRDLFAADPERYAPRIGGFCAVGAVSGRMVDVDPEQWLLVRGRLYLYLNAEVRKIALDDLEESATKAEAQWVGLQKTP